MGLTCTSLSLPAIDHQTCTDYHRNYISRSRGDEKGSPISQWWPRALTARPTAATAIVCSSQALGNGFGCPCRPSWRADLQICTSDDSIPDVSPSSRCWKKSDLIQAFWFPRGQFLGRIQKKKLVWTSLKWRPDRSFTPMRNRPRTDSKILHVL